jgi:hypothetical protein
MVQKLANSDVSIAEFQPQSSVCNVSNMAFPADKTGDDVSRHRVVIVANRHNKGLLLIQNVHFSLVRLCASCECEECRVPADFDICALRSKRFGAQTLRGTMSRVD